MARGDVVWIDLPSPIGATGREQIGRRPAVIIQDDNPDTPTLIVLPFTSQSSALRFNYTIRVEPSRYNGLLQPSILLVFQLRAIDRARVKERIGQIEPRYFPQIENMIRKMLGL